MEKRHIRSRITTLAGAAAIGLFAIASPATAAFAEAPAYGNIDPDATGSLNIHKYLHQDGTTVGDLSGVTDPGFTDPVADVEFTVYPLIKAGDTGPLDLTVQENWNGLDALVPGTGCTAPNGYTLGTGVPMPLTDATGLSTIDLDLGLYQVCETDAPAVIVERALPFIVTIPMPFEGGWVYDVHAYPKNGEGSITKSIEAQESLALGSVVRFPTTVPVPTMQGAWTGFGVKDTLDTRLTPVAAGDITVAVGGVTLDPTFYTPNVTGQTMSIDFTAAGIAWLNEGPNEHVGKEITVTFAGTVNSIGNGVIENTAEFWPNNPGFDPNGQLPMPSNKVRTNWGAFDLTKYALNDATEVPLANASFELYAAEAPYGTTCDVAIAAGAQPISVGGKTTFTTDSNGQISFAGLFVSDSVNPVIDSPTRCYVLKETAAPAGYVLPTGTDALTAVTLTIGSTSTVDNVKIENVQQSVPNLPLTGAAGQVLLIAAGVSAAAVAGGLVLMRRRKENAAAAN